MLNFEIFKLRHRLRDLFLSNKIMLKEVENCSFKTIIKREERVRLVE